MNIKQLSKFLVKAKINTYISSGESREKVLSDGSKEFKFTEGVFKYRDRYFGLNFFVGEEIVWENRKAVWGMNYYGKILSEITPTKSVYQFLRGALKKIKKDKPFRGPDIFLKDNFRYFNKTKGSLEKFEGEEKIFYKRRLVYRLIYGGGIVIGK